MDELEQLRNECLIVDTAADEFHAKFDDMAADVMENVRSQLVETVPADALSREIIIGQLLMIEFESCERLTIDTKERLVRMADWMGPDRAQALYHAARFITKVV